jgi:pyrimidine operon attenuation protein/uracil phosphoribosyltransferase
MTQELATTNLLLGIMAAVSVLEALVCIGIAVAGYMIYRRVMTLVEGLEQRQVAPAMARVNSILDDVKGVTTTVKQETERVDHAIRTTLHRVDDTADRVKSDVRARTSRIVGLLRGIRVAIQSMLEHREPRTHEPF